MGPGSLLSAFSDIQVQTEESAVEERSRVLREYLTRELARIDTEGWEGFSQVQRTSRS